MQNIYRMKTEPKCDERAAVAGKNYRFTVLTPWLLRLEYSGDGVFEDRPSQCVLNRNFPVPDFQVIEREDSLKIVTEGVQLFYDKKPFSPNGLSVQVRGNLSAYHSIWHFGEEATDLLGTARTLDEADGAVKLEHGLISRNGYSVLDDSASSLIREDGWIDPRPAGYRDLYFFGYGHAYQECLKDFYRLTGGTPLLPRFVLGNWWSRYHRYTQEEYEGLMERFRQEEVPFSVAVIDMDWHLVDIDPKYGSGWTGYTWNRELFPDPEAFLKWLHERGMKATLNVHPAEGVRPYEERYPDMAAALGKDPAEEEFIEFDAANPDFLEAYFSCLHHPLEEQGVDFWWVDWQQGGKSRIPGLDPLWVLNHFHYLDSMKKGERGLTFSRYAGLGSHRYPIGFSGDSIITWDTLDFQPYFTANASNAGYGWWSHDIGGHMNGYRDEELATRWIQFGVFSPILRLHSSNSPFTGKEPWNYNPESCRIMKRYLKLRHELVPYLYSMNWLAAEGQPLIRPMYYLNPEDPEAYEVPNQYWFGTELIACPVTRPADKRSKLAAFTAWLPEGSWYDIFTGDRYDGGRKLTLYRSLENIPVLAKAGGIVPMADLGRYTNSTENPKELRIRIFPGADGTFRLREDDGISRIDGAQTGSFCDTVFRWDDAGASFTVAPPETRGELPSWLPQTRSYTLEFYGFEDVDGSELSVRADGKELPVSLEYSGETHVLAVRVPELRAQTGVEVKFTTRPEPAKNDWKQRIFRFLFGAEIPYGDKERIFACSKAAKSPASMITQLQAMNLEEGLFGPLCEILLAEL